jgi:hypothetical protein
MLVRISTQGYEDGMQKLQGSNSAARQAVFGSCTRDWLNYCGVGEQMHHFLHQKDQSLVNHSLLLSWFAGSIHDSSTDLLDLEVGRG